ncbi:hypothetical protein CANINC_002170 [Pichia inconspicua]|uniref:Kinesin-like protein n=1 Tax=Pichia inconspicua TaxID=52247 RepID=A0A4T0X1W6_9ASCO|nr:hypothetical protein CANINC_002170 [[Candida] inconspicua]
MYKKIQKKGLEERPNSSNSITSTVSNSSTTSKHKDLSMFTESIDVIVRCRGRGYVENESTSPTVISIDGEKADEVKIYLPENINESNNNNSNTKKLDEIANIDNSTTRTYKLDKVYGPTTDQMTFFQNVAEKICEDFIKGFNCTIFAYGQTGAGKTYTMCGKVDGNSLTPESGVIPRCLKKLFESELDNVFLKCSFVEIYNENLKDLLSDGRNDKLLKIYEGPNKAMKIKALEEFYLKNFEEAMRLLQIGLDRKKVAGTKMNAASSRSHTIFTVYLVKKRPNGAEYQFAKLNLVDLAGSENINRSGSINQRAKEAGSINQSLLTLGRVINSLVDGANFIPYRESKLTRLLQDSLGGRTKTVLVANIAPTLLDVQASMSTLEYASKAKNIQNVAQIGDTISEEVLVNELIEDNRKLKLDLMATRRRENCIVMDDSNYKDLYLTQKTLKDEVEELKGFKSSLMNQLEHQMKKNDFEKKENEILKQNILSLESKIVDFENKIKQQQENEISIKKKCNLLYSEFNRSINAAFDMQVRTKSILTDKILRCLTDIYDRVSEDHVIDNDILHFKDTLCTVTDDIEKVFQINTQVTEKLQSSKNILKFFEENVTLSTSEILNHVNEITNQLDQHQENNKEFKEFINNFLRERDSGLINEMESQFTGKLDAFKKEMNLHISRLLSDNINETYARFLDHYQRKLKNSESKWSEKSENFIVMTLNEKSKLDRLILDQQNNFTRLIQQCMGELKDSKVNEVHERISLLNSELQPLLKDLEKIDMMNMKKDELITNNIEFIRANIEELENVINKIIDNDNLDVENKKNSLMIQMKEILNTPRMKILNNKENENILKTPSKNNMNKSPEKSPSRTPFKRTPLRRTPSRSPTKSVRSESPHKDVAFGLKRSASTDFEVNMKRRM